MTEIETVKIPKSEYDYLKKRDDWLSALEDAGVDNWQSIDYAKDTWREWHPEEDL